MSFDFKYLVKRTIFALFCSTIAVSPCFAIDEVEEIEETEKNSLGEIQLEVPEKHPFKELIFENQDETLAQKILQPKSKYWNLVDETGHEFESGLVKNFKIGVYVRMDNEMSVKNGDFSDRVNFNSVELTTETLLRDEKTKLNVSYNFVRNLDYDNHFFQKFSNLYVDHNFTKNQSVRVGNARVPVGIEGGLSSSKIMLVNRGQVYKKFADARSFGIRNIGKYKYAEYDIGWYDSSRFMNKMFQGSEFAGNLAVKPLAKFNGKYGDLKLGTSIDVGDASFANNYSVYTAYAQYKKDKFYWDFEYAHADGAGGKYINDTDGQGFFTTVAYKVTPKIELLGRYDYYKDFSKSNPSQEFTAGVNFYNNPHCKLVLNYVYKMAEKSSSDSHKIYIGTRFNTNSLFGDFD